MLDGEDGHQEEVYHQFSFSDHSLDTDRRELRRGSDPIAVEPQVFDLLVYLLQNRDRVVSKEDLIAAVWGGRIVSDSTMTSRINAARKAIGDSGEQQKLIRTVARKGLRFVGAVTVHSHGSRPDSPGAVPTSLDSDQDRPRSTQPRTDRPAIAVLPFINMSGDPEQEYFSDGITEDIITALSKLRWFFVIARNSSFIYKGRAVHIRQIADEVGVGYVVEGSVRKGGDRVRITVQLNDVATGSHIWAERYDRELADVFAVQDEITEAIVAAEEAMRLSREGIRQRSDFVGAHRVLTAAAGMAGQPEVGRAHCRNSAARNQTSRSTGLQVKFRSNSRPRCSTTWKAFAARG